MTNKKSKEDFSTPRKKEKEFSYPRFIIGMLIILSPVFYLGYSLLETKFRDPHHQVPIICTVTVAEQYTSTSSGRGYGSSRDYLFFKTEECRNLLLPISSDDDYQSMLDEIQIGKKYEFMMGESQVGVTWGAREVFSYSGPVE